MKDSICIQQSLRIYICVRILKYPDKNTKEKNMTGRKIKPKTKLILDE